MISVAQGSSTSNKHKLMFSLAQGSSTKTKLPFMLSVAQGPSTSTPHPLMLSVAQRFSISTNHLLMLRVARYPQQAPSTHWCLIWPRDPSTSTKHPVMLSVAFAQGLRPKAFAQAFAQAFAPPLPPAAPPPSFVRGSPGCLLSCVRCPPRCAKRVVFPPWFGGQALGLACRFLASRWPWLGLGLGPWLGLGFALASPWLGLRSWLLL